MPGDELVRFRLECSTRMYVQSTDILDQQGLSRFEHDLQNDFHTIVVRFLVLLDFSLTVKALPHEREIRTSQP